MAEIDVTGLAPLWRIAVAMLLGSALGFERELARKPAGLRTHMLVAGGAALLVCLGDAVVEEFDSMVDGQPRLQADPLRIIEAVITGVSFLGAGTIIRRGGEGDVTGLTTAATLLVTAGIGVGVAVGHVALAVGTTVIVLATLFCLGVLEERAVARAGRRRDADRGHA